MSAAPLLCPSCGLEVLGQDECPECGVPCVPAAALRLSGGDEDAEDYSVVAVLRDPFEGEQLLPLFESRRIPVMLRGTEDVRLADGWLHGGSVRFGVVLAPLQRLDEARALVRSFREEVDAATAESEASPETPPEEPPPAADPTDDTERVEREPPMVFGRERSPWPSRLFVGLSLSAAAALTVALAHPAPAILAVIAVCVASGFAVASANHYGRLVVDRHRDRVEATSPVRAFFGVGATEIRIGDLELVSVRFDRAGFRVFVQERVRGRRVPRRLYGPERETEKQAVADAHRIADRIGVPFVATPLPADGRHRGELASGVDRPGEKKVSPSARHLRKYGKRDSS